MQTSEACIPLLAGLLKFKQLYTSSQVEQIHILFMLSKQFTFYFLKILAQYPQKVKGRLKEFLMISKGKKLSSEL